MLGERFELPPVARTSDARISDAHGIASPAKRRAPARLLERGELKAALTFSGQGEAWWHTLATLPASEPWFAEWLDLAEGVLSAQANTRDGAWSGLYAGGVSLRRWLRDVASMPAVPYLTSTPLSAPLIFLAQLATYHDAWRRGLGAAFESRAIVGATGYSQGIAAALLVAERADGAIPTDRLVGYLTMMSTLGFEVARGTRAIPTTSGTPVDHAPMASVTGPERAFLAKAIADIAKVAGPAAVTLALANDRKRHVVSGAPEALVALQALLTRRIAAEVESKKAGKRGGNANLALHWDPILTDGAFHSPLLTAAAERIAASPFRIGERALRVFDPTAPPATTNGSDRDAFAAGRDATAVTTACIQAICTTPGAWQPTLLAMAKQAAPDLICDFGPGEGIARLTAGAVRGTGIDVFQLTTDSDRERFFAKPYDAADRPLVYADFAPKLAEVGGKLVVDNRFARATGAPPILLPGMTPTTVDAGIVAAAANAGYWAELAGGGQVSEAIFDARLAELQASLAPGAGFYFNALLLDAYLWGLQLGDKRLVQKARAAGHPILGVIVTAGIPPLEDAVRLLGDLAALGMHCNAFKPGTRAQIDQVIAIARAAREHTIFVHIEGGKAGGHHSWEDLDGLLLETYHALRSEPNLVVCVGGGIADEARATSLLLGTWSEAYGLPAMPVDAVFVGTAAMACREATATASVKAALVDAGGTDRWVGRHEVEGGVTSGRSQLDADIHYLDNAAARCGRLLDQVAGDAAAVATRQGELIAALAATAKPYFGDLATMTYGGVLARMLELMAIGDPSGPNAAYEDGPWLDVTWRTRFFDVVRRAEARLTDRAVESVAPSLASLDQPTMVLADFVARWPEATTTVLHPADVHWFVREVCARPGKPVPFVPVLDGDVRRWYKSDSLWQAQHPRYAADQTLIIPGPAAVAGIRTADEPVAELLGRFDRAFVGALTARGERPVVRESLAVGSLAREDGRLAGLAGLAEGQALRDLRAVPPRGCSLEAGATPGTITLRIEERDAETEASWLAWFGSRYAGPLAQFMGAAELWEGARIVANPLRRLLVAEVGASVALTIEQDRLVRAEYRPAGLDGRAAERVVLAMTPGAQADALTLDLVLGNAAFHLPISVTRQGAHYAFVAAVGAFDRAVAGLYGAILFEAPPAPVALFTHAIETQTLEADRIAAYRRLTGWRDGAGAKAAALPLNMVFSVAWRAVFRTLSNDELAGGMLRLVHADHRVEALAGWPLVAGDAVSTDAVVTRIEDHADHRLVTIEAIVSRVGANGHEPAARLGGTFHIRGGVAGAAWRVRAREPFRATVRCEDEAQLTFLRNHDGLSWLDVTPPVAVGDVLTLSAELHEDRPQSGPARCQASGTILRNDVPVGHIGFAVEGALKAHPLRALVAVLADGADGAGGEGAGERATPRLTRATATTTAPATMHAFADVGGDHNPIHVHPLAARLANLPAPIVHGLWTAARLHAFAVELVAGGDAARVRGVQAQFLAPVMLGETLVLKATRTAIRPGGLQVLELTAHRTSGGTVATVRAELMPARTAYIFPGQGIQQKDMGLGALGRSPAAKRIWERADAHTRDALGFSILRVVRENPSELIIAGTRHVHPQGVLHLTQLTQVAMATLACAQVAELREANVWVDDAILCGHSVGEYTALAAAAEVLPLEAVIDIVYARGLVMHGLVPRDAHGDSGFKMGVIRPHYAAMDHAGAEALVTEIAGQTGRFLEIVNYNVKGRQYSVTGHADALEALEAALEARRKPSAKPPYVEVPGIDVPFHSHCLRGGVPDFRSALERHLPARIDANRLVGRYIPNLVAVPFTLTPAFIACVRDAVGEDARPRLQRLLDDPAGTAPDLVARVLLIELLAWQFASPVRWIETQEILVKQAQAIVEVGVGYQPTLTNMAKATLDGRRLAVEVFNVESDRARVFAADEDTEVEVEVAAPAATAAAATAPGAAIQAAPAAVATAAPAATVTAKPDDRALTALEALLTILAVQAKVRPEQITLSETIDALFDGVSSRRNQVLLDIGAEFDVGTLDRAHETPIGELGAEIGRRAKTWKAPGAYLAKTIDESFKKAWARAGMPMKDIAAYLEQTFGFGPGLAAATIDTLALELRTGASARGGELGQIAAPASKDAARGAVDRAVERLAARRQTAYGKLASVAGASGGGAAVDPKALAAFEDRLFGKDGVLTQAARALAPAQDIAAEPIAADPAAAQLVAELGSSFAELVQPAFDAVKHVAFGAAWMPAQRDLARAAFDRLNGRIDDAKVLAELTRLAPHAREARLHNTATWFAGVAQRAGLTATADALAAYASGAITAPTAFDFRGKTALVTGASKGSIAIAIVGQLLAGGARVVVTTSTLDRARTLFYRRVFEAHGAPGAELHVVPFNQASFQDHEALVDWLFREETEQSGATAKVLKPAMRPDFLVPFAAMKDWGTLDQLGTQAEAALRAMVLGTERLIGGIASRLLALGETAARCHVLLPLSPNHGAFGGDGAYAESKAALEVLLAKWKSEQAAWARATTIVGARIGWVRGTGLMAHNDALAPRLEATTGIHTFSQDEMGRLLTELLDAPTRLAARSAPVVADLTGGFAKVADLKGAVDGIRTALADEEKTDRAVGSLIAAEEALLGAQAEDKALVSPLAGWPSASSAEPDWSMTWPETHARPEDLVVIVGFGELSPGGTARTRFELEVGEALSAPAVLELAWMAGLIRFEPAARGGAWIDVASGEQVAEGAIRDRYQDAVRAIVGVRFTEPKTVGFDPARMPVLEKVYLERDFTFPVGSEEEAQTFVAAAPEGTRVVADGDRWLVTRKAGTELRVPREVALKRKVSGQLPTGFDLSRYGFPGDMLANVDRVALMNLGATVDAFVAAGTTPEELLQWVHPVRVGSTQSAGMGGMQSLHRLYIDHILGRERQSDVLQETLINVVFAYAATSYVGCYGPMSHPVAACATAAVSIEDACDKIRLGKADVIMAGGWDDLSGEGTLGFGDMNATADTDKMEAMGLAPHQMSRANDRRRRGFVEAQGGGVMLLARGDIALQMGLPVYGVVAFAGSYSDGIHRSIPAPGIGALGAASGGKHSVLARALAKIGLHTNDIGVVSKHDTSTNANDPNESGLHQGLQTALGRTPGNPLLVVSQKTVLGHAKGGAAAWQAIGLCQVLSAGVVPGNRNLDAIDPVLAGDQHLLYSNERLAPGAAYPLRAGVLTSLGFGHVSALVCLAHPMAFAATLAPEERATWLARQAARKAAARGLWARVQLGQEPLYHKRTDRRFAAADGTEAQKAEETAMLLAPEARLGAAEGKDGERFGVRS